MKRRSVLRASVAGGVAVLLPRFAIGQSADARVLRFVPQAVHPCWTRSSPTAAVTANHAWMVWDTLFGVNAAQQAKPQMADGYTISDDGRTYLIKLREGLKVARRRARARAGLCSEPGPLGDAHTFGQTAAKSVDEWGVADDKTVKDDVEAALPVADRRDCRAELLHYAGAASEDDPFKAINEVVRSGSSTHSYKDEFVPGSSAALGEVRRLRCRARSRRNGPSGGKIANFQRIEWKIITDAATASAALQNGEVDWYEQAQADLVPLLRRNSDVVIAPSNPQGYIGGLRFNCVFTRRSTTFCLRRAVLVAVN